MKNSLVKIIVKKGFTLLVALSLGTIACTKKTSSSSSSSGQSITTFTNTLDALTLAEKQELAKIFGLSLEEFQKRLNERSFTLEQLQAFAAELQKSQNIRVSFDFSTSNMSYTPEENQSNLSCYAYARESQYGFPGKDYLIDSVAPTWEQAAVSVRIVTNENNVPTNYVFGAKFKDSGCGARLSYVNCTIWNQSEYERYGKWYQSVQRDETNQPITEYAVPKGLWMPGSFLCFGPNFDQDQLSAQIILQVFAAARENDVVMFKAQAFDGVGNYTRELGAAPIYMYSNVLDALN